MLVAHCCNDYFVLIQSLISCCACTITNLLWCCVSFLVLLFFFSSHVVVSQGWTPLHGVGISGLLDLVDPLVERGAVIDAKNKVSMGPAGGPVCRTRRCHYSYLPASPTPPTSPSRHTHLLLIPLFPACDSMRCFR